MMTTPSIIVAICCLAVVVNCQVPPFIEECILGQYPPTVKNKVPTYVINLDLPPAQRWNQLAKDKAAEIKHLTGALKSLIKNALPMGDAVVKFIDNDMGYFVSTLPAPYNEEMKGLAAAANMDLGEVVLFNIFYEVFTVCTSIVAQDTNGKMYHARNLDFGLFMGWNPKNHTWSITEALKPTIVNLDFQKGGKTLFKAVQFAGYVGILTAVKPGVFSVSINDRFVLNGGFIGIAEWLIGMRNSHWVGFITRDLLTNATSYKDIHTALSTQPILAPCYFIIGGAKAGEGAIISRDRAKAADVWDLGTRNSTFYLLETNYDHWKAPLFVDDRRHPGYRCMNKIAQKGVSFSGLYDVLSSRPMKNKLTTYTALMDLTSGRVETYLQDCPDPCPPW